MRLKKFGEAIARLESVYLDTNVFIYHLEDVDPYSCLTQALFKFITKGRLKGQTSALTVLELNVRPYQLGFADKAAAHIALLNQMPYLEIHPLDIEVANRAALLRAEYRLKTPDAVHYATGLQARCDAFIGNDSAFKKMAGMAYLHLDDWI